MACARDCPALAELDKVNPLAGETAVFFYQTDVLGHELETYRSKAEYSTLPSSPNLCT